MPESVVEEAAIENGAIIGSAGGDWLNHYDAVQSVFFDAGAHLAADEACEHFVIMQDFLSRYFDRYWVLGIGLRPPGGNASAARGASTPPWPNFKPSRNAIPRW